MSHPDLTYPDDKYTGETGEVSSTLRRTDHPSDIVYTSGGSCDYLATGESTGGGFGLYRWNMVGPGGPGPHFHRSITESFYVLEGVVELHDGSKWIEGGPGDFLFVPEGGVHGFRNTPDGPAQMLILFTPGAPREDYFETLAAVGRGLTMSDDERAAFMLRHDTFWVESD